MSYNTLPYEALVHLAEQLMMNQCIASPDRGVEAVVAFEGDVVAKQRARAGANGKHYTPKETREFEAAVAKAGKLAMHRRDLPEPLVMPVVMHLDIWTAMPANFEPWQVDLAEMRMIFPEKQDTDNKVKAILDGLNGIVLKDDRQVCRMIVGDTYAKTAGFVLRMTPVGLTRQETMRLGTILKRM